MELFGWEEVIVFSLVLHLHGVFSYLLELGRKWERERGFARNFTHLLLSSPLLSSYIGFLLLLLLFFNISTFPFYPPSNQINPKGLFKFYPSMKLIWLQCHKNPSCTRWCKICKKPSMYLLKLFVKWRAGGRCFTNRPEQQ